MSVASPPRVRTLTAGEVAWAAVLPCGLLTLALIVLAGPPLGHAFLAPRGERLWPREAIFVYGYAEPVKHGRYVVALLGPALLAAAVLAGAQRELRLGASTLATLAGATQLALAGFLIAAVLGQNSAIFPLPAWLPRPWPVFGPLRYALALAAPLLLIAARRRPGVAERIAAAARETNVRRRACLALAVAFAATWLLSAVDTDGTIGRSPGLGLVPWTIDDAFAILDGSGPLVGYHAMYAHLWPYPAAAAMALFGTTIGVFTVTLVLVAGLALLAVYAVFRRVARSSPLALALFAPFVAIGFLPVRLNDPHGPPLWFSNAQVFSMWPLRYAGPYLLAWLTARHVDGAAPRRTWALFLAAGLVLLNNAEFGTGAVAATLLALACTPRYRSRHALPRLALEAAAGLLAAVLLVTLLTLAVAGTLPHFADAVEFARLFGVLGLTAIPMPLFGLHLVLYATFVAAIGLAAVRIAQRAEGQSLTSMLAWSGTFGLIAASYWIGRSDDLKLVALFSTWAFALAFVTVVVGARTRSPRLAPSDRRRLGRAGRAGARRHGDRENAGSVVAGRTPEGSDARPGDEAGGRRALRRARDAAGREGRDPQRGRTPHRLRHRARERLAVRVPRKHRDAAAVRPHARGRTPRRRAQAVPAGAPADGGAPGGARRRRLLGARRKRRRLAVERRALSGGAGRPATLPRLCQGWSVRC
ncbi:MAG TPA: hypothetical protein VFS37_11695 [Conexibacter sp.]|nr:hypothetical protein [Conexibacter sp.]